MSNKKKKFREKINGPKMAGSHELLKALRWEKILCIIEGHSFLHYHKTSDAPSLAGITPQTLAALISRPIRPPDQEHLDFLLSALLRTTVALDRHTSTVC